MFHILNSMIYLHQFRDLPGCFPISVTVAYSFNYSKFVIYLCHHIQLFKNISEYALLNILVGVLAYIFINDILSYVYQTRYKGNAKLVELIGKFCSLEDLTIIRVLCFLKFWSNSDINQSDLLTGYFVNTTSRVFLNQ